MIVFKDYEVQYIRDIKFRSMTHGNNIMVELIETESIEVRPKTKGYLSGLWLTPKTHNGFKMEEIINSAGQKQYVASDIKSKDIKLIRVFSEILFKILFLYLFCYLIIYIVNP
eukprot:gene2148-2014_t